jgi:hypothetical protein
MGGIRGWDLGRVGTRVSQGGWVGRPSRRLVRPLGPGDGPMDPSPHIRHIRHHTSYPIISDISEARVYVAYVTRLYDKTKGAQYAPIIEEDDESRVKLL